MASDPFAVGHIKLVGILRAKRIVGAPTSMRADICHPDDKAAVERFQNTLQRLGADLGGKDWAIGCDIYRLKIGGEELSVFSDTWSIDIEGPDDLVGRVLGEYQQRVH